MPELNQYDYDTLVEKADNCTKNHNIEIFTAVSKQNIKLGKENQSLKEQVKRLQEENLKIKIELDDAFGNSAKWKEENQSLKQKIEEIKRHHIHAGYMGNPQCHNCKILSIIEESQS